MKLIVAGLPKTGTKSLQKCLEMLSYKVFDTRDNFLHYGEQWGRIMRAGGMPIDFRDMFSAVDACTDVPSVYYWEEMLAAFPDSKVILMVRDDEEQWCNSMINQLHMLASSKLYHHSTRLSPSACSFHKFINDSLRLTFGIEPIVPGRTYVPNPQALKIAYRNHNARVKETAPKDRLLVFNCREGWRPLCEFLNCPVPEVVFPHENKRGEIVKEEHVAKDPHFQRIQREVRIRAVLIALLLFLLLFLLVLALVRLF